MTASLFLSLLTAAQDTPPPRPARPEPPRYICSVRRETPLGRIGTHRSVSLTGVAGDPLFNWETPFHEDPVREDRQFFLMASWSRTPSRYSDTPCHYSDVQISFHVRGPRPRTIRLRLQDMVNMHEPSPILSLDSGPTPARDGWTHFHTQWGILTGFLDESYSARFIVLGDDQELFRSAPVDPATFRNAREMAERLEPELAPLVADYRNRCRDRTAPIHLVIP